MSGLGGVITRFQTGTYKVTRQGSGSYVDGRWVVGPTSLTFNDKAITAVDADEDTVTIVDHDLESGDGPVRFTTDDTLPAGLSTGTDYWVVAVDDDTLQFSTSLDNAMQVEPIVVDITDEGTGSHELVEVEDETERQNIYVFGLGASIQPATGDDTSDLPEGVSTTEIRTLYTNTMVRGPIRNDGTGAGADVIEIDGNSWRVWKVEHFTVRSNHYRATIVREESVA